MPSFDISSKMEWQELDNAINQTQAESTQRYDFKGVKVEITLDRKARTLTLWSSVDAKMDALSDIFKSKLIKRGISLFSFEEQKTEDAFGGSQRKIYTIQAGISKEKAKKIIDQIKDLKIKVQSQIQDEQVRVTGKNRDDLQMVISYLKGKQNDLSIPLQFDNFRD